MPTKKTGAVTLNDQKHCEAKVATRTKFYDKEVKGLFVSITTSGEASFGFKFTNPKTKAREVLQLGWYVAGVFGTKQARSKAEDLKKAVRLGEDVGQQDRRLKRQAHHLSAKTVDELIDEYVDYIKAEEPKPWLEAG